VLVSMLMLMLVLVVLRFTHAGSGAWTNRDCRSMTALGAITATITPGTADTTPIAATVAT
jgi:hypothetical protein